MSIEDDTTRIIQLNPVQQIREESKRTWAGLIQALHMCPSCGSYNLKETLIGGRWSKGKNPNKATCSNCRWTGSVDGCKTN